MKYGSIKSKQVLELGNYSFLKTDFQNNIYLYNKNYNYLKEFSNNDYIQKINNLDNLDSFIIIHPDLLNYAKTNTLLLNICFNKCKK